MRVKEIIVVTILGLEIVGGLSVAAYAYGKYKYKEGQDSAYKEATGMLDEQIEFLEKIIKRNEEEA